VSPGGNREIVPESRGCPETGGSCAPSPAGVMTVWA